MHALLGLVLIVGTAFHAEKKPEDPPHIITVIPFNATVTDGKTHDGGSPAQGASAAPAPASAPAPTPKPVDPAPELPKPIEQPKPAPEPKHEEVSELPVPKPKTKTLPKPELIPKPAAKMPPKPRDIPDITKPTVRNNADQKTAAAAQRLADQKADDRARGQHIAALNSSLNKLGQNLSVLSSGIESIGGGGGGAAEINYRDLVFSKYDAAWTPPPDIDDAEAITKVKVVIARSGKVSSAEIIKASGNSVLDKSVRRAIDSLSFIAPFPESSKDSQRIFIINFNLKAKKGLG